MPDAPDWFKYRIESAKGVLGDMAELAVRLGSPVNYDRLGTVVFADSFEHGLSPYVKLTAGTGSSIDVVASPSFHGGFALMLTDGSDSANTTGILKRVEPQDVRKLGFECSFYLLDEPDYVRITIQKNTADTRYLFAIKWEAATGNLYYYTEGVGYVLFANAPLVSDVNPLFYTWKLVIDLENLQYIRLACNQQKYSLANIDCSQSANVSNPRLEFSSGVQSNDGDNDRIVVDSFIITNDELV